MDKVSPTLQYTLFFIFILVYFSAHDITKVNIMRQLQYGAGGFSYKSIKTSQELFPLIIFGCKFLNCTKKNEKITIRLRVRNKRLTNAGWVGSVLVDLVGQERGRDCQKISIFFHFSPKFKLYLGRISKCICVFEQIVFVYLYIEKKLYFLYFCIL